MHDGTDLAPERLWGKLCLSMGQMFPTTVTNRWILLYDKRERRRTAGFCCMTNVNGEEQVDSAV